MAAVSITAAADAADAAVVRRRPPELDDAEYAREVLRLSGSKSEADLDRDLATKATDLDISVPDAESLSLLLLSSRPSTAEEKPTSMSSAAGSADMIAFMSTTTTTTSMSSPLTPSTPGLNLSRRPLALQHARPASSASSQDTASTGFSSRHSLAGDMRETSTMMMTATTTARTARATKRARPVSLLVFPTTAAANNHYNRGGSSSSGGGGGNGRKKSSKLPKRRRSGRLTFSHYEKYISTVDPNLAQPSFQPRPRPRPRPRDQHPPLLSTRPADQTSGLFSVQARREMEKITKKLAGRIWKRKAGGVGSGACICCREDFPKEDLQPLPCGHSYCEECLAVMIDQSMTDESKMPPRCCTQPIPADIVKAILPRDAQQAFLKAVMQYSTPWETRVFCPNVACNEFIPPRSRPDAKRPFEATCSHCETRVCLLCKRAAHHPGQDCPEDWDLEAVLRMGERSGWRRCYKCRTLVELVQGCTHMTCRCKAQFCYICGAVWDPAVGCPNFCNGEEELERRRAEEEARLAEQEAAKRTLERAAAEKEAARREAERRTRQCPAFAALRDEMVDEMTRFQAFHRKARNRMWARQSGRRQRVVERYTDLAEKMEERHAKTEQHLEDRQVEAESELRRSLDHQEKSILIRLKHMEAYCHGASRAPDKRDSRNSRSSRDSRDRDSNSNKRMSAGQQQLQLLPSREVTQKHLDQLTQQYYLRDGMARRHQAQINVLREKQAKRMEELTERQQRELAALHERRAREIEDLTAEFAEAEDIFFRTFAARKRRMRWRWALAAEIRRVELEGSPQADDDDDEDSVPYYAPMQLPEWPPELLEGPEESSTLMMMPTVAEESALSAAAAELAVTSAALLA